MMTHLAALLLGFHLAATTPETLPKPIPLWNGPAPLSHGTAPTDIPTLTPFFPKHAHAAAPAIIICPGGGYQYLSMEFEGYNEARWFQAHGVAAFVLQYRLPSNGYRQPVPMLDGQRAIRLVRSRAAKWHLNPHQIGVIGFSAGGHLASTLETHYAPGNPLAPDRVERLSSRPDFAVLVYAVISMQDGMTHRDSKKNLLGPNPDPAVVQDLSNELHVNPQTPPTLLIAVDDDTAVPIANSRVMYAALQKAGVPTAFQEYPHGGHGFGYGHVPDSSPPGWMDRMGDWLSSQGFMPAAK